MKTAIDKVFEWTMRNVPPIIFVPLILCAVPLIVLGAVCLPGRWTGLADE